MAASGLRRALPFAAGLVALGVVAIVALTVHEVDVADDGRFRAQLAQLERLDQRLEEDVLRARLGDLPHYDGLALTINGQLAVVAALQAHAPVMSGNRRVVYRQATTALAQFIERKEQAVYRFVRENAVLQNSFTYLVTLARDLGDRPVDDEALPPGVARRLQLLLRDVFVYYRTGEPELGTSIDAQVGHLRDDALDQRDAAVAALIGHAALLRATRPVVEGLAGEVRKARIGPVIGRVLAPHAAQVDAVSRAEAVWRGALVLIVAGLLAFLGRAMLRREQAVRALGDREQQLAVAKELAEVTLHSIGDAVVRTDLAARVTYMNPVAEDLTGWTLGEARGRPVEEVVELVNEHDRSRINNPVHRCLDSQRVTGLSGQALLRARGEREYAITDSAAPIRDSHGTVLGAILVFQNVSEERRLAAAISHQARHDPLTGLLNRREFEGRLAEALVTAQADACEHVMGYLDLDQFKLVNDVCGHLAGDELLKQLTLLLVESVRGADLLGRLGGDEFGLLLFDCPLDKGVVIAEQLRKAINDFRFTWDGRTFDIRASIGLVAVNAECESVSEILKQADMACYAAKDTGRNRVHVYTPSDAELSRRQSELQWVASLREAIARDRFQLFVQPIVSLRADAHEERWHEVLLRMRDAEGRMVAPGAFVPAGERYNVMAAVDRWVIDRACTILHERRESCAERLAINLSGDALNDADFFDYITETLGRLAIAPGRICFELTETAAVANFNRARALVGRLRELGCQCALDDFGSGLSSFAYLKNLPVNVLKIDGSFVRDMAADPTDHAMVAAINNIGHVLGIQTVAEFVEDSTTLAALKELGVDYGQGYALGRPHPIAEL